MKINFKRKHILAKNIALIDGQSGSGKSLIGPIVSSLSNSEYWTHDLVFEQIIILLKYKKISLDAARSILGIHADKDLYNLNISRDINFRTKDTSGVKHGKVESKYRKRLLIKDGDCIVNKILKYNPYLLINTHHLLMNSEQIKKIFYNRNLIVISIARNPITLIKNFNKQNWEDKYENNPREFTLTIKQNKRKLNAWYLNKYGKNSLFIEKYASFVIDYYKYQSNYKSKNHILIYFEKFICNPEKYIPKLENYFGERTTTTHKLLRSFDLPRNNAEEGLENDLDEVLSFIKDKNLRNKIYSASKKYKKI